MTSAMAMAGTSSGSKTMAMISARAIGLLSSATLTPAMRQTRHTSRGMKGKSRNTRIPSVPPMKKLGKIYPPAKPVEKEKVMRSIFTTTRTSNRRRLTSR